MTSIDRYNTNIIMLAKYDIWSLIINDADRQISKFQKNVNKLSDPTMVHNDQSLITKVRINQSIPDDELPLKLAIETKSRAEISLNS